MKKKVYFLLIAVVCAASNLTAQFTADDVQFWVGEGANSAILNIDFVVDGDSSSFAWGYHFDGTTTGEQMLNDVAAADNQLTVNIAGFLNDIYYQDYQGVAGDPTYWSTWSKTDDFADWVTNMGISTEVSDGQWFGCSYTMYDEQFNPINEPGYPVAAMPSIDVFTQDDILFWVGEGANSAILNIDFVVDGDSSSFAWGYHFDGTTTGEQMLNDVAAADNQLTVNIAGFLNDIYYQDYQGVAGDPTYWSTWSKTDDFADWVTNMGIGTEVGDGQWFGCSYTLWDQEFNPINEPGYPVAAMPSIDVFTQDDILFWVGEGANSAILNIDFVVDGDSSSFAWGYHFDATTTGAQMLEDVAAADEQLTVNAGDFLNDIFYFDYAGVAGNPTYWSTWSKTDDFADWVTNMGIGTEVSDGQWFGCSYTMYDEQFNPINEPGYPIAATNNNYVAGPYAPGADEVGTTAIPSDSDLFTAWATQCVVERGSMDISDANAADVSYGEDNDGTGIADGLAVVSLGDGGSAILTFDYPIVNGEGADFAVFENGFGDTFLELAFVEVSSDGVNYFRFPSSSLTQTEEQVGGFGELDPTYIHNLAGKYRANFGTPFDLEDLQGIAGLDINAITHVKIIDVVGSIDPQYGTQDAEGNFINDPFTTPFESGGFDLDGVGVINTSVSIQENELLTWNFFPNPAREVININTTESGKLSIVDQTGKLCLLENIQSNSSIVDISDLAKGMYFVSFVAHNKTIQKVLVVE